MKKQILLTCIIFSLFVVSRVFAQQQESYTFCTGSRYAYLLDTATTSTSTYFQRYDIGYTSYVAHMQNDTIYQGSGQGSGPGSYASIKKYAITGNNTVSNVWTYTLSKAHHDICPMPNGNILVIVDETINLSTYGGSSTSVSSPIICEIKPTGATTGTVVWEWHLKDHLCQTSSSSNTYATYVTDVKQHPELFYVACTTNGGVATDWFHANGLDYNPTLDQIVWCSHIKNELYVIDHSTTTAQAATHTGGKSGKGGDFLYRWGSPENYGCTADGNGISLSVIHDVRWIPATNKKYPNHISLYHNGGCSSGKGTVIHLPPYNGYNYTYTPGQIVGPTSCITPTTPTFDVSNQGGTQVLENGNILICRPGRTFYECNGSGTTYQTISVGTVQADRLKKNELIGPFLTSSSSSQTVCKNTAITLDCTPVASKMVTNPTYTYAWSSNPSGFNSTSKSASHTPTSAGTYTYTVTVTMTGTVGTTSVTSTNTSTVTVIVDDCTGIEKINNKPELTITPNPSKGIFALNEDFTKTTNYEISIYNSFGEQIMKTKNASTFDLSEYSNGIYFITIKTEDNTIYNKKIIVLK